MSASIQLTPTTQATAQPETKAKTGILAGAQVMTMSGAKPIETLKVGDRIITRGGMRVLRSTSKTQSRMRPVRIAHGTLGCSRPKQEMLVAPGQEILVRDWRAEVLFGSDQVIVPISRLIDGTYIASVSTEGVFTAYTLGFDEDEVFYADGIEVAAPAMVVEQSDLCVAA